jgi:CheY-like chemotaxis protein
VPDTPVILLVEDRDDDVLLVRRAFQKADIANPLQIARDGEQAIAYLSGVGQFSDRSVFPLPGLILLDLKLPGMDGFEVLQWLRRQPGIAGTAVVVLTSSEQLRDVNRAYALGANSFLVKPLEFESHIQLSKLIREYWLKTVKLPEVFHPPPGPDNTDRLPGSPS